MSARLAIADETASAHQWRRGFACQHSWVTPEEQGEHQPLVVERHGRTAMLVMDGRIDNRAELISALGARRLAQRCAPRAGGVRSL